MAVVAVIHAPSRLFLLQPIRDRLSRPFHLVIGSHRLSRSCLFLDPPLVPFNRLPKCPFIALRRPERPQ